MAIYMQSTIELRPEGVARFTEAMAKVIEVVEGEGWHLVAAMMQSTGRLHTGIDVWTMPDMNAFQRGLDAVRASKYIGEIGPVLAEAIERETVVLGTRAEWLPEGR